MTRKRVVVYLEPTTIERLKTLGNTRDTNLSVLIRGIIAAWLDTPIRWRTLLAPENEDRKREDRSDDPQD